jgi:hypothetical protein
VVWTSGRKAALSAPRCDEIRNLEAERGSLFPSPGCLPLSGVESPVRFSKGGRLPNTTSCFQRTRGFPSAGNKIWLHDSL